MKELLDLDSLMGDRACWLAFCPDCDAQVSVVDDQCPDCGTALDD